MTARLRNERDERADLGPGFVADIELAEEERRAFDKLSDILRRKPQWRFFRTDEVSPRALIEDFVRLFNQLRSTLGVRDTPLLQTSSVEGGAKIGRNERCPCGSGKKYKKCCGGVQASMAP